jgi:hypothetical protein
MHNIDYQEFGENTVIPLHGGSYFVRRPLDTDPRTFNGDRDAAWRMDVSDAFAETLQRHEYQPPPDLRRAPGRSACVFGAIFGVHLLYLLAFAWIGA